MPQPPALVAPYITIEHYQSRMWVGTVQLTWTLGASPVAQWYRSRLPMQETQVWSLGWEDPLEEESGPSSDLLVCLFHYSSVWSPGEEDHRSCSGVHGGQASVWAESMKTMGFGVGQTWVQIPPLQLSRWVTLYLNNLLVCRTNPPIFPSYYQKVEVIYAHYSSLGKHRKIYRGKI